MSVCVCIQGVGSIYLWAVSLGAVCMSTEAASANTGPPALAFWLSNDQQRGLWLAGGYIVECQGFPTCAGVVQGSHVKPLLCGACIPAAAVGKHYIV